MNASLSTVLTSIKILQVGANEIRSHLRPSLLNFKQNLGNFSQKNIGIQYMINPQETDYNYINIYE